ncbi:MAG: DUF2249 domain-containing protein [Candidatus Rokubacteria bacterium]|nr:DUF2249 domain-containing protein [Candidatus Rokubacteria bacterium]
MIAADTTIARLLEEHPEALEVLVRFHPHFQRFRNRLLRKLMAPRVTIALAARCAGVPANDLLRELRRELGEPEVDPAANEAGSVRLEPPSGPRPSALAGLPEVHVDVHDDIRRGVEPFARIMAAVKALGEGEALALHAPFEPVPLYDVLGKRGLSHWTECHDPGHWSVWFYREPPQRDRRPDPVGAGAATAPARRTITLDVRGLEPPQPMVRVLEQLDALEADGTLVVIHERRPMFLYPLLAERGFVHETQEPEAGLVRILIRRGGAPRGV